LYNTDINLINKYKPLFDKYKIGIILVLTHIENYDKYRELNNILIYYFNIDDYFNIYSIYNLIFIKIEKNNFDYLILFNDDLNNNIDENDLKNIKNINKYNNYIIIDKNIFKKNGFLDDISYYKDDVFNYLLIKNNMMSSNDIYNIDSEILSNNIFYYFFININYDIEHPKKKNIFFYYIRNRYNISNLTYLSQIKKYFINIDLREDRFINCIKECEKINIENIEKFPAIKPSIGDVMSCPFIDISKMWKKDDKYLIGATGCKMSHLNIMKKALKDDDNNYKYILILEDDVIFDEFSIEYINLSLEYIEKNNINFDILYLSVNLKKKDDAEKIDDSLLKIKNGLTTTGQIFKYSNLNKIIDIIENSNTEIDNTYQNNLENKYCVYPMCVYQKNFYSDINSKNMDYGPFHRKYYF
jgi:GR25 family glycosyltransferase involved in LPS biosynthesis